MLELRSVSKHFGGVKALDNVTIEFGKRITGVVGPNGAGKTTMFNVITGHVRPDQGAVVFMGQDITSEPVHARVRRGIVRSFQQPKAFWSLSVLDSIEMLVKDRSRAEEILRYMGLWERRGQRPGALNRLDLRRLEIARCLALRPRLMLLDEPMAGLAWQSAEMLGKILVDVSNNWGVSMIIVEHKIPHLARIAEDLVVVEAGRVVARGPAEEVVKSLRIL